MKTYKVCGFEFPQDLYLLINKYADPGIKIEFMNNPSKENLEKFIESGIEESKKVIPELPGNEKDREEYPPLLYYTILSYLELKHPGEPGWRNMETGRREEIIKEVYSWIKELKEEVK